MIHGAAGKMMRLFSTFLPEISHEWVQKTEKIFER